MTRPNTVMSASEDRMTDLIDRLTLYEHRAGYDGKDWEKIASEAAETLRALSAAPRPIGEGDAWARCQKCGGEIEGWICQSCGQEFRENDAGDLVFGEAPPAPSADSGRTDVLATSPLERERALSILAEHLDGAYNAGTEFAQSFDSCEAARAILQSLAQPARRPKDRYTKYLVDERDIAAAALALRSLSSKPVDDTGEALPSAKQEAVAWREKVARIISDVIVTATAPDDGLELKTLVAVAMKASHLINPATDAILQALSTKTTSQEKTNV